MATVINLDKEFIKFTMEQKGLTVKALAERMDRSPQAIRKYLNGADRTEATVLVAFLFSRALDCSIDQLCDDTELPK